VELHIDKAEAIQAALKRGASNGLGFLLVDPAMSLIYANEEALQILNYPAKDRRDFEKVVRERLHSILTIQGARQVSSVTEFVSGRRHYCCRTLGVLLRSRPSNREDFAVLLERTLDIGFEVRKICEKHNLTKREQEAVAHVVRGLSVKEAAACMEISPNTVKAFLRFAMLKMQVSGRSAIMAKIIESKR